MEEEEKKYYGQGLRKDIIGATEDYFSAGAEGLRQLSSDPVQGTQTVLGTGLTSSLLGNVKPGIIGSAAEKQMFNRGTATLTNPAYRNLLGKGIVRQGTKVAGIPIAAAVIAGDTVLAKSAEAQAEMDEVEAYQKNLEQQGIERAQDQAMTMRKYNIIEEQRAARENRTPYGYDPDFPEDGANINVTNIRDYLAQVPEDYKGPDELDFSSIDLSGQSQFPYYKDQSLNTGIDFSKFAQGEQPVTQPNLSALQTEGQTGQPNLLTSTNPDFRPEEGTSTAPPPLPESQFTSFLGNLANQGVSADDRAAIAGEMLRGMGTAERNARNAEIFQRARDEYAAKYGADSLKPKVGFGTEASASGSQGGLTMGDYRNMLRAQGIGGSEQISLAKQMMQEAQLGKQKGKLQSDLLRAQIAKAQRPEKGRAPSAIEIQAATIQQLVPIQQKLEAGIPISAEEEALYRQGSTLINLQQRTGDFGSDPAFKDIASYQQQDPSLPSADDPDGIKMIEQVMSANPGKSKEQVIASLKKANKIS